MNPHRDQDIASKLANKSTHCKEEGAKPIIDSLKGTKLPESILEPVLHARSMAMSKFPSDIKPVLTVDEADEFVAQRDKVFAEMMKRNDSMSSVLSSPTSTLSPDSGTGSMGRASPSASSIGRGSVTSRNGSLSSSSVASPLSSVPSPPISPPTQSSAAPSPDAPASAQAMDTAPVGTANGKITDGQASVPTTVAAPSPNALASVQQTNTPPLISANGHTSNSVNSMPQAKLASVPATNQGQFTQLQRERPTGGNTVPMGVREYIPMLTAPTTTNTNPVMEDQNGVQSPPSVVSSLSSVSSPPSATVKSATQQQGFVGDGQFVNNGGSFSGTPSPFNSAVSNVSSPPSVFSPESSMGTNTLHTAVSTDSIPSVGSLALPFQNFHTPNFAPQVPPPTSMSNSFNTQIPSNFNFNSTTSPYSHPTTTVNLQNSTSFATNFDSFVPENQMFDSSDPLLNPNDPVMHQLLSDMVALNSDQTFSATNMNTNFTHSHPQAPGSNYYNFAPVPNSHASAVVPPQPNMSGQANSMFAMSCDVALTQLNVENGGNNVSHLLPDSQIANSNPEVQDILQQFQ